MKFPGPADAFRMWRCEGPRCFAQKRARPFASTLQSVAAVEASKNQLLRDFRYRSIFDFCNTICAKRTFIRKRSPRARKSSRTNRVLNWLTPIFLERDEFRLRRIQ